VSYCGSFYDTNHHEIPEDRLQGRYVRTPEGAEGRIHGFDPEKRWPIVKWADGTHGPTSPMDITIPAYRIYPTGAREIVSVLREAHQFCTQCSRMLCRSMTEPFPEHDWIALLEQVEGATED
jgi:hypothetical protein